MGGSAARYLARWEVAEVTGAVVAVDVIRAFTTAAHAFGAGARSILLVDSVDEALALKAADPRRLVVGEDRGRRPAGFDLSNSPVAMARADVDGRTLVQRTSAGTRGVVAARSATRLWAASLVCASATAAAVAASRLGSPSYVITGRFPDDPVHTGDDDLATAQLIERARVGEPLAEEATAAAVAGSARRARRWRSGARTCTPTTSPTPRASTCSTSSWRCVGAGTPWCSSPCATCGSRGRAGAPRARPTHVSVGRACPPRLTPRGLRRSRPSRRRRRWGTPWSGWRLPRASRPTRSCSR